MFYILFKEVVLWVKACTEKRKEEKGRTTWPTLPGCFMARPPLDTAAATFPSRSTTTAPTVSRHPEPFSYKCTFSNEEKPKHSHSEADNSSLSLDIYKINDVVHEFMNHSPLPFIFHHKCAFVISIGCFTSLIAVCFGSELFVNHHDSDCMINRVLRGKFAKWHHDT